MSRGVSEVRRQLGRATSWSLVDVFVVRLGNFALGLILARLLAPADFGAFAVALVVHAIVVNVSDLGVGTALIRDPEELIASSSRTVATIAITTSLCLAAMMMAAAGPLARGLGSPGASKVIVVMALNLPLAGLSAVPSALVRRYFRMDRLFVADVANLLVTYAVAIPMAAGGGGASSLAWSWVASQAVTTVILCSYYPRRCVPGFDRAQGRRLLRYGLPLAGANVLGFGVQNSDYVVVGRLMGSTPLGLYLMAFNMSGWPLNIFSTVIRNVALPTMSRLQDDRERLAAEFAKALRLIASVTFPLCLLMAALATPLVTVLYGERWRGAGAALVGLAIFSALRIGMEPFQDFVVAGGRTKVVMLIQIPWLVGLVGALLLGVHLFGIAGAGAAQAAVAGVLVLPVYATVLRKGGVTYRMIGWALAPPMVKAGVAAGVAWAVAGLVSEPWLALLSGVSAGLFLYGVECRREITDLLAWARVRRAARRPGACPDDLLVQPQLGEDGG